MGLVGYGFNVSCCFNLPEHAHNASRDLTGSSLPDYNVNASTLDHILLPSCVICIIASVALLTYQLSVHALQLMSIKYIRPNLWMSVTNTVNCD